MGLYHILKQNGLRRLMFDFIACSVINTQMVNAYSILIHLMVWEISFCCANGKYSMRTLIVDAEDYHIAPNFRGTIFL